MSRPTPREAEATDQNEQAALYVPEAQSVSDRRLEAVGRGSRPSASGVGAKAQAIEVAAAELLQLGSHQALTVAKHCSARSSGRSNPMGARFEQNRATGSLEFSVQHIGALASRL